MSSKSDSKTSRKPMQSNNFLKEEIGNITNIIYFVAWNKMGDFWKTNNYHKNRIHALRCLGKIPNEVYRNVYPRHVRDGERGI